MFTYPFWSKKSYSTSKAHLSRILSSVKFPRWWQAVWVAPYAAAWYTSQLAEWMNNPGVFTSSLFHWVDPLICCWVRRVKEMMEEAKMESLAVGESPCAAQSRDQLPACQSLGCLVACPTWHWQAPGRFEKCLILGRAGGAGCRGRKTWCHVPCPCLSLRCLSCFYPLTSASPVHPVLYCNGWNCSSQLRHARNRNVLYSNSSPHSAPVRECQPQLT